MSVKNEVAALRTQVEELKVNLKFKQIDYDAFARMRIRAEQAEARLAEHLVAHKTDAHDCAEMEECFQREKAHRTEAEAQLAEATRELDRQKAAAGECDVALVRAERRLAAVVDKTVSGVRTARRGGR